ncbi:MAG TPA: FHA domain-containing protein [Polyangiaceae bacterium]|nr:FHA domain-containing protein [Polyangiaceae bacterium]
MAKKLKVGDSIHGYRITKVFGPGMMAISYAAETGSGKKVFFKQYKSPAPTVVWYAPYIAYQKELNARVHGGRAAHFAVRQVDAFEELWGGRCYFQAYEFVEHGGDVQQMLDAEAERHRRTKLAPALDPAVWARHLTWAKVLVAGVAALHEVGVVHADLKPPNAYLVEDASIGSGYQLKLIDMDFSVLADRRPPWHGFQGYVGSDNYRSPEHLTRGAVPEPASDVFTCALMLYELLAGVHPYWRDDQVEYAALVKGYRAKPPALLGMLPMPALNAEVSAALHRALSPDPAARPTAGALRDLLNGRGATAEPFKKPASAAPATAVSNREPLVSAAMLLTGADGSSMRVSVRTQLGKALVRRFGPDAAFWDERQCVLERGVGRQWRISPIAGSVNETLLNGRALTEPRALFQGDVIAVGRQEKGLLKLPLTAQRS